MPAKRWQTYEEVAAYLLNQLSEHFGVGRFEVKQIVAGEVVTHTPDGAGIGINSFGLQALEFEVLEMGLVALIKISLGAGGLHAAGSSRNVAESPHRN
jgi:hypothetical protein